MLGTVLQGLKWAKEQTLLVAPRLCSVYGYNEDSSGLVQSGLQSGLERSLEADGGASRLLTCAQGVRGCSLLLTSN